MCATDDIIKSPLNYTGNKSRILSQLLPLFPKKINRFIDLCCGGATVGLNVLDRAKEVVCLDINKELIELLQTIQMYSEQNIVMKIEDIINKFNLSDTYNNGYDIYKNYIEGNNGFKNYNKEGYTKLRDYFNSTFMDPNTKSIYLLTLLSYCFNNDMRFNSAGKFNMPIGKTDFNVSIREKLHSFKVGIKNKNIKFYFADFSVVKEFELGKGDFVYCDPPYLITNAVYNSANSKENQSWTEEQEKKLLNTLDFLNKIQVKFALSNVLSKEGIQNDILIEWVTKNKFNIIDIDYNYKSASYNKKNRASKEREVVVTNYDI